MESDYIGGPQTSFSSPLSLGGASSQEKLRWWRKPDNYKDEMKVWGTRIPVWRAVLSVCMIYGFYLGVDFTASLCTQGSKFICAVALIVATVYVYWALWWDEPVIIPPSLTFFNVSGYNSLFGLLLVCYETTLVATAALIIATAMLFTYVPLDEIFKFDC